MIPLKTTPMKSSKIAPAVSPAAEDSNVMIQLHNLKPSQTRPKYKRVGRGNSSGKGTTAGRGTKGQRARTGGRNKLTRRGMKHLIERTPKNRGFLSRQAKRQVVTLEQLQRVFNTGEVVTPVKMKQAGLIDQVWPGVKVLDRGDLKKKLTIQAHAFSVGATAAITAVGGTANLIPAIDRTAVKRDKKPASPDAK